MIDKSWSSFISYIAKPREEAPNFSQPLQTVEVIEGTEATLKCMVTGNPEPNIAWFKDGDTVAEEKRYKTQYNGEQATFKIQNTELDDEGEYKCVAENHLGSASCSAELLVNEPNTMPEFEEKMKPVDVIEGELAKFSVKVAGNPPPVIDWFKGKDKLEDEGRIEIIDDEDSGNYTLIINGTLLGDAGTYKCIALNEEGERSCKAALAVKEAVTKPEIVIEPEATQLKVAEGDVVSLSAIVKGKPVPTVDWCKDDEKLRETSRLKIDAKDGEHSLLILEAKPEDSGVYKCQAKSKGGNVEKTYHVDIKGSLLHVKSYESRSISFVFR